MPEGRDGQLVNHSLDLATFLLNPWLFNWSEIARLSARTSIIDFAIKNSRKRYLENGVVRGINNNYAHWISFVTKRVANEFQTNVSMISRVEMRNRRLIRKVLRKFAEEKDDEGTP